MKVKLFSPILVILIMVLSAKLWVLFNRIEVRGGYIADTATTSILVDNAYAVDKKTNDDKALQPSNTSVDQKLSSAKQKSDISKANNDNKDHTAPNGNTSNKSQVQEHQSEIGSSLLRTSNMSDAELKLLQELSKRRQDLDKNQRQLKVREQVLKATENKIDQKMLELKDLQTKLEEIMKQYDQKELGKIMTLVKIYENMKPRDAAKIFDELEMPVLLQVVSNMKEIKVAPVLASMNPIKARDLSIELARQKTIAP